MQTKKAPFKPSITLTDYNALSGGPDFLSSGLEWKEVTTSDNAVWTEYTGAFQYKFILTINTTVYYIAPLYDILQNFDNVLKYRANTIDEDIFNPADPTTLSECIFSFNVGGTPTGETFIINPDTTANIIQQVGEQSVPLDNLILPYQTSGIINPNNRPLELMNINDGSKFLNEEAIINNHFSEANLEIGENNESNLGADLAKTVILLLRQLNLSDVTTYSGTPAFLTNGQVSGTIGTTIGSADNVIVLSSSAGQTVFESSQPTQKISKDTILKISIPELSGIKSYNGIDQSIGGRNLSGVGKDLAILPREEFQQGNNNGSLVYVSPFENWININNATELNINQLSVEVRQPSGEIAGDLRPDTICQIKLREDPKQEQRRLLNMQFDKMSLAISSATNSGQILSTKLNNVSS